MSLAMSRNHASPRMREVIEAFGLRRAEQHGSVGLKVGLIVQQICDLYIHLSPRTKFWDTCAPQVILEEAGGKLTDLFGDRITYNLADVQNHNGILATNGAAHEKAVERLRPVLNKFGRPRFGRKFVAPPTAAGCPVSRSEAMNLAVGFNSKVRCKIVSTASRQRRLNQPR